MTGGTQSQMPKNLPILFRKATRVGSGWVSERELDWVKFNGFMLAIVP